MPRVLQAIAVLCAIARPLFADGIAFEKSDPAKVGLDAILVKWYDLEMTRQGGPGKVSHGWWPWGLRAFDYDNDGDLDLLASHHGVPGSLILKSMLKESGELRFVNATADLGLDGRDLPGADDRPWIWDLDGDGRLDIAGFSDESRPQSARNRPDGKFELIPKQLFTGLAHPREVVDLDGDGRPDLDGGRKGQWIRLPDSIAYRHDKSPRFPQPADIPADVLASIETQRKTGPTRFHSVEFLTHDIVGNDTLGYSPKPIDLDGDGKGDLVIHGSGGYGAVYLGRYLTRDAAGKWVDRTADLGLPIDGAPIHIDDLTGDGRTDVVIAGEKTGGLWVQGSDGKFARRDDVLAKFLVRRDPYLLRAYRADFDCDGDPDLILSSPRLGRCAVYENRGAEGFHAVLETSSWENSIVIVDIDGDGLLDFVVGGGRDSKSKGTITLHLNRTRAPGKSARIRPTMTGANPYAIGAVVEVFAPGGLDTAGSKPLLIEKAHPDATPIHVGLGTHAAFDVRVTFPGGKRVERKAVPAGDLVLTPG